MRWVVGLLLVCAAVLKAVQLVTEPASMLTMPFGHWLLSMQISVELGIGLLALTGVYWRQLRWFALLLFSIFSAYSSYLSVTLVRWRMMPMSTAQLQRVAGILRRSLRKFGRLNV